MLFKNSLTALKALTIKIQFEKGTMLYLRIYKKSKKIMNIRGRTYTDCISTQLNGDNNQSSLLIELFRPWKWDVMSGHLSLR